MDKLHAPEKFNLDSRNLADAWKRWKEELNLFIDLVMDSDDEPAKVKMFQYLIGTRGREIYDTMVFAQEPKDRTLQIVLGEFDKYCNPKKNETVERYRFNTRNQLPDETFDKYVTELKILSTTCNYGALHDSLIRDRLVCGIIDSNLRERLLRDAELTLEKCIQISRASELSKERIKTLETPSSSQDIHAVKQKYKKSQAYPPQSNKYHSHSNAKTPAHVNCKYCGKKHEFNKTKCPAFGKDCRKCGKPNHFETMCRSGTASKFQGRRRPPHRVRTFSDNSDSGDDFFEIKTITLANVNSVSDKYNKHVYATMTIKGKDRTESTRFQIDSGATCNVITTKILKDLKINQLQKTDKILSMYNNTTIKPIGTCSLKLINPKNDDKFKAEFFVVKDGTLTPILGNKAVQAMNLLTINYENIKGVRQGTPQVPLTKEEVLREYGDIFDGIGKLEGQYHLELDENAVPVVHPPRKVPISIKDKLLTELERLSKLKILTKVSTPTPWVSSLVTVMKRDKLRICIDPKHLNQHLKRSHYPLPTIEDLLPELSRAKIFSVVDAKHGFWHVELDDESSHLTTFNTPFGRYRWLRMPFGISSAPEEYQRRQDQTVEGLSGARSIIDDILIYGVGDTEEEAIVDHDQKFRALMKRCRERNLKLNKDKLQLKLKEVRFIGHLITSNGLKPDPEKVRAVLDMLRPKDASGVRRIIGFVTYLSKFLPKLSDICEPLRKLTLKDSDFSWHQSHDNALDNIKKLVTAEPVLKYYDPKYQLVLQSDAPETGLGAAIMQENQPIAYASRALTDTETRYAQIEKELLSVIFGLQKFHQYTYGRTVQVTSDHKPLESILKKPLHAAPKRLQRMLLQLQKYDIRLQYKPGKERYIADTLSRAYLNETTDQHVSDIECVNMLSELPISEQRIAEIQENTNKDEQLQELKYVVQKGWPERKWDVSASVAIYFDIRDELTVQNGLVFKGERVVIPKSLRTDMINRIHSSHIGVEGCLRRARESLYWPNMNAEIKDFIQRCETCRRFERKQQKETLIPHEIPSRPWSKVGIDLMTFHTKNYLVTVDYYSNYWEVDYLDDTLATTVIKKLRAQFSRHGIPDTCFTDNGPQFNCGEFSKFSEMWEFKHNTSSPLYAQSNGKVEQAVQTVKRLMNKSKYDQKDPYLAFLDFRNTSTQGHDTSPVQRLMNRRTRTLLPTKHSLLKPESVPTQNVKRDIFEQKEKQRHYYNRHAKDLEPLKAGDTVRIQPSKQISKEWRKGTVKQQVNLRSYEIDVGSRTYRRNRRQIKQTLENNSEDQNIIRNDYEFDTETMENDIDSKTENIDQRSSTPITNYVTCSGRTVKPPSRFADFVRD